MRIHHRRARGRQVRGQRSKVVGHPVEGQRLPVGLNRRAAQGSSGLVGHPERWGPVGTVGSGRTPGVRGRLGSYRLTTGLSATTTRRHPISRRPSTFTAPRPWPSPTSRRIDRAGVGRGHVRGTGRGMTRMRGSNLRLLRRRHRHRPLRGGPRGVGDSAWCRVRCGGRLSGGGWRQSGGGSVHSHGPASQLVQGPAVQCPWCRAPHGLAAQRLNAPTDRCPGDSTHGDPLTHSGVPTPPAPPNPPHHSPPSTTGQLLINPTPQNDHHTPPPDHPSTN